MARIDLDMDVLRTLVIAQQLGGFNRAAEQVGRSQSAVSQQIHKLDERIGQRLFRKQGRGLVLTEAGEVILAYAKRIIELNDEAVAAVRGVGVDGSVRVGLQGDFADTWLPAALGRFKRAHPNVRIEATIDRNYALVERLDKRQLDLAVIWGLKPRTGAEVLVTLPMIWVGRKKTPWRRSDPIALALFSAPCFFRAAAIAALDSANVPWRVEFTSLNLSALWAAVDAGLGITVRTIASVPNHLVALRGRSGLPRLPSVKLCLDSGGRPLTPPAERLKEILLETMPPSLTAGR